MKRLVIVEGDEALRNLLTEALAKILPQGKWDVTELNPTEAGADIALERMPDICCALITYSSTPQGEDGVPLVRCVRKKFTNATIIVVHQLEQDHVLKSAVAGANALIYKGSLGMAKLKEFLEQLHVIP